MAKRGRMELRERFELSLKKTFQERAELSPDT